MSTSLSGEDILAGASLTLIGSIGILIQMFEFRAIFFLSKNVIGYTILLPLSVIESILLIQYGVWPGLVILFQSTILPTSFYYVTDVLTVSNWFTMVYMHVLIGITRFICVFCPMKFRCLTRKHYLTLAFLVYDISLIQGLVSNFLPWFVVMHYDPKVYGITTDRDLDSLGKTIIYYFIFNGAAMGLYVLLYGVITVYLALKRKKLANVFRTKKQKAELRLIVPCAISTIIFIIGQLLITYLNLGKWAGYFVMLMFCTQCISSPVIRMATNGIIRNECMNTFRHI